MTRVYVALGSNLGDPLHQANQALIALSQLPMTHKIAHSCFYRSKPMGPSNQPDYLNAVVMLETDLSPHALLTHTQKIEQQQGRERQGERWGPRTLDLDILLYGNMVVDTSTLTIPHYGMKQREFILQPLFELAPDLILPDGCRLLDLLKQLPNNRLQKW